MIRCASGAEQRHPARRSHRWIFFLVFQTGEPVFQKYDAAGTLVFERRVQGREIDDFVNALPTTWQSAGWTMACFRLRCRRFERPASIARGACGSALPCRIPTSTIRTATRSARCSCVRRASWFPAAFSSARGANCSSRRALRIHHAIGKDCNMKNFVLRAGRRSRPRGRCGRRRVAGDSTAGTVDAGARLDRESKQERSDPP